MMRGHRARTDQTGSYRITNLPAGTYAISTITPSLVPANQSDSVVVAEGEEVQDVNVSISAWRRYHGKNHRFRRRTSHRGTGENLTGT